MPNIIQTGLQNVINWALMAGAKQDAYEQEIAHRQQALSELYAYYEGRQRRPLRVSPSGRDYNVLANMTGIVIDRSVSMLVGGGVDFNTPGMDDESENSPHEYIEAVWDANNGDILLHDLVQFGSIYGTPYIKIIPNGREYEGKIYPRLVALNPYNMVIVSAGDDFENVLAYINR